MPTREQLETALRNAHAAGDADAARRLATALKTQTPRKEAFQDLAEDTSFGEALLVGIGRGMMEIPRGLGLVEREDPTTTAAIEALKEERPYTTGAGEIIGEVAPFVAPGLGVGAISSLGGRVLAGTALGGAEGAILSSAKDKDVVSGTGIGAAIGGGAEILFPVIGRLGRSIYQRVTGKAPKGALLDAAGRPTDELNKVLDEAGMTFDDLTEDAAAYVGGQTGADPEQLSRALKFAQAGVSPTKGELTQEFAQQATEQRLMQSAADPLAEQFRQFKLTQSEGIKDALSRSVDEAKIPEETGVAIKDALENRRNLLRTQKNELYAEAAENATDAGGIPLFTGAMSEAVPDQRTIRRTDRISKGAVSDAMDTLAEYGVIDPTEDMLKRGVEVEPLSLENFDELRQALNQIERADTSGASSVVIRPIRDALDSEVDNLSETLIQKGFKDDVVAPLKEARRITSQLKKEFSPQSLAGRLIETKKDNVTPIVEASRAYSQLTGKSQPVENVRKVMSSLKAAGEKGQRAIADIQASTVMDLIEAGFGTKSRTVDGIQVFNPIAFRNRIDTIGKDKLASIFGNNKKVLGNIKNIENIAKDLTPPAGAVPKGSASVILDLMDKLGVASITTKVPGGGLLVEQIRQMAESGATRKAVGEAIEAAPEIVKTRRIIEDELPGIATALGVALTVNQNQ